MPVRGQGLLLNVSPTPMLEVNILHLKVNSNIPYIHSYHKYVMLWCASL